MSMASQGVYGMTSDRLIADHSLKRADFISALFHACFVISLLLSVLLLSGCTSHFLDDREGIANSLTTARDWVSRDIQTHSFTLRSYGPPSGAKKQTDTLTVYIEGDGLAWKTRTMPALDPTPDNPVALKLALSTGADDVAYLARPCQYTITLDRHLCNYTHWTQARYSEQIVRSMDEGLSALKVAYHAKRIRLIGYSGGGVIAALLAARRSDIVEFITLASNLDIDYWTRIHRVTPLRGSLNPARIESLAAVTQVHFVGEDDKTVPAGVVQSYLQSIGLASAGRLRRIPGMAHDCCWSEIWPDLYGKLQAKRR